MKLFVDVGNTAMKWRLRDVDRRRQGGYAHDRDWTGVARVLAEVAASRVESLVVASVAGQQGDTLLREVLERELNIAPRFVYSSASACGVRNAYREPRRLGVDRWLALIEAWHRAGPAIIIDCGSALTIDAVDADGVHLGGYIVPGLGMLRRSLLQNTADVHLAGPLPPALGPGCSTTEGVEFGILRMTVAFVTDAVVELRKVLPDTCSVFLTGGDAPVIEPFLPMAITMEPDLVLDGLERMAKQEPE